MVRGEFTVLLDSSASISSEKRNASSRSSASKSTPKQQQTQHSKPTQSSFASGNNPLTGPTQGPFIAKQQHPELAGLRLTDDAIKMILRQEGYQSVAYPDAAGYSVGYGHFLGEGDKGKGKTITPSEGLKYLAEDLGRVEKAVLSKIKVPISDKQLSALVSFAYNAGHGPLDRGIADKINRGDLHGAADQMKLYNKSKDPETKKLVLNDVLVQRREFETGLLLEKD